MPGLNTQDKIIFRQSKDLWNKSPTTVLHLAQNKFEGILRSSHTDYQSGFCDSYFGYTAQLQTFDQDSSTLYIKANSSTDDIIINTQYLISTEGTLSSIRRKLQYEGKEKLQHLINIHFKCQKLQTVMKKRPGMLYFVFNQVSFSLHKPLISIHNDISLSFLSSVISERFLSLSHKTFERENMSVNFLTFLRMNPLR